MEITIDIPSQGQLQAELWFVILVGLTTLAIIFLIIFLCKKFGKKKILSKPKLEDQEVKPEPVSVVEPIANLYDYKSVGHDNNLFYCLSNKDLFIRVIENSKDKDKAIFASSLAHQFDDESRKLLLTSIPQIIDVSILDSHELTIHKSPAVYLVDIKNEILTFLFNQLKSQY